MEVAKIEDFGRLSYRERLLNMRSKNSVISEKEIQEHTKLPRIVLKDPKGRNLDTFTPLQEAIYRAELNVRTSKEARTAEEWRLPHAPLPSRPDFSRATPAVPRLKHPRRRRKTEISSGDPGHRDHCLVRY